MAAECLSEVFLPIKKISRLQYVLKYQNTLYQLWVKRDGSQMALLDYLKGKESMSSIELSNKCLNHYEV